jgi:hypothetical protein
LSELESAAKPEPPNPFSGEDVRSILIAHGWLPAEWTPQHEAWCARAAALLGPRAAARAELESLVQLVFEYDAHAVLTQIDAHVVLSRQSARDVVRALAHLVLEPVPLTTDRFREIIEILKQQLDLRSRDLFHPLRLALAGRVGEGTLDRVVLLLDEAAALSWSVPVKSARARIVEFCASLD